MFDGPATEIFRGVVVSSDKSTGSLVVNLPTVLGQHGSVPVGIINTQRYDGLYEVPDPGTQVIVGTEDADFSHAFLINVDPGSVRKSPDWNGTLTNGIVTSPGTAGWIIDGGGNVEFHNGRFRGTLEIGTTINGAPVASMDDVVAGGQDLSGYVHKEDLYLTGTTNISGARIRTGLIQSNGFTWDGSSVFATAGTSLDLGNGDVISTGFRINNGVASFSGALSGGTIDIGGMDATSFHVDVTGRMWVGAAAYADAKFKVDALGNVEASGSFVVPGVSIVGGAATFTGTITSASTISGATITGATITGGSFQTAASPAARLTIGSNGEVNLYDSSNARRGTLRFASNNLDLGRVDVTGPRLTLVTGGGGNGAVFLSTAAGNGAITNFTVDGLVIANSHVAVYSHSHLKLYSPTDTQHKLGWVSALDGPSLDGYQNIQMYSTVADAQARLQSDGNFVLYDNGSAWGMKAIGSSAAIKQEIRPLEAGALTKVNTLRPVSFKRKYDNSLPEYQAELAAAEARVQLQPTEVEAAELDGLRRRVEAAERRWRDRLSPEAQTPELGFIAEELEVVEPRLVSPPSGDMPKGIMYQQVTALLVKAIQELDAKVEIMRQQLIGIGGGGVTPPTPPTPPGGRT